MILLPKPPPRKVWITAMAALVLSCGSSLAQNFTMQVTDTNPLGLGEFGGGIPKLDLGVEGGIKGAFAFNLNANTAYNSNFFLTENDEESEVYATLTPMISYTSDPEGGAEISFNANYTPVMTGYLENSELNGIDHSGDATLQFKGGKTEIAVFGRMIQSSGTDRLTGDFVNGTVMTGGVRATRQMAPRTSMNASLTAAMSDYGSDSTAEGSEIYSASVGGIWQATERLGIGPTLRYTMAESDLVSQWDAWALLFDANYKVTERIWLSASLGPEFSQNSGVTGEGSSMSLSGNLSASYVFNERWTWTNRINSATVPSPSETNYMITNVGLSTMLTRQLIKGSIGGGLEMNFSEYEQAGTVTVARGNEQNMRLFLNYNRNLFSDRIGFNSTVSYAFNEGLTDWSQFLVSAGLNVSF